MSLSLTINTHLSYEHSTAFQFNLRMITSQEEEKSDMMIKANIIHLPVFSYQCCTGIACRRTLWSI